jgi:hypothetical protein
MGPKVEAALRLARAGKTGIIASLTEAVAAVEGRAGTRIVGAAALGSGTTAGLDSPVTVAQAISIAENEGVQR